MIRSSLLAALTWALLGSAAPAALVDGVAAVVDGRVVTLSEVREASAARSRLGPQGPSDPSVEALEFLIEKALLENEASRLGAAVSDAEVEKTVADIRSRNGLDDEAFRAALAGQGLEYEDYLAELRSQILRAKVAGQVLRPRLQAEEDDLREYYLKNVSVFCEPDRLRLGHVEVPEGREAAEAVRARIAAGEPPEAAATPASYKDMGLLERDSLAEVVQSALQGVAPGGVSPVVELGGVCHLFVLKEEKKGVAPPYEGLPAETKEVVRARFYETREQDLYRQWMDSLKQKASIERIR